MSTAPATSAVPTEAPADRKIFKMNGLRGMISKVMTTGWSAPRVALGLDIDMTNALAQAKVLTQSLGIKITPTHIVLKTIAATLANYPRLNALVTERGIEEVFAINLAVAVHSDGGLIAPVICNVQDKSMTELANELADTAEKGRQGKLPPSAFQRGTFTLSNLATAGIDWVTPVLNPPQVAIMGMGRTRDAVVAVDGVPTVRKMATFSLIFDHRAVDGTPASYFLRDFGAALTEAKI